MRTTAQSLPLVSNVPKKRIVFGSKIGALKICVSMILWNSLKMKALAFFKSIKNVLQIWSADKLICSLESSNWILMFTIVVRTLSNLKNTVSAAISSHKKI
jgi:hypothetical protein